ITTFVEIEKLFIRAPRASVSGELGPSNDARLRMYVRRIRASGAGIADEFLEVVRTALSHYGVTSLEPGDALERAVLRLLSAQRDPALRHRLLVGVVGRITALVADGLELRDDLRLDRSLTDLARLRPQVGNTLADAAIEASYRIYLQPGIEARAARTSRTVESWLASSETHVTTPPVDVLLEVAAAPREVFDRVGHWISGDDSLRSEIALAVHTQRRYAPRVPSGFHALSVAGRHIYGVDYSGQGLVLATRSSSDDLIDATRAILDASRDLSASQPGKSVYAIEVMIPPGEELDFEACSQELEACLEEGLGEARFTLGMLGEEGGMDHVFKTWRRLEGRLSYCPLYDLHPETADRIDLARYENFELERIPAEEGIYPFYGCARDVPGDERVFVLGDMRDRAPTAGQEFTIHLPAFERTFQRSARSLRSILQVRDPRRRLQWNRIAVFVAPSIYFDTESIEGIAGRLAPATRNLGLEKVLVRLNLLDRANPDTAAVAHEIEIIDSRDQMEISLRPPHHDPLQPAQEYERKILITRRNRQPYPYEVIKMLTQDERNVLGRGDEVEGQSLPMGEFEEYDFDPARGKDGAFSIEGRPYGENLSGIVFGLISTPTPKVPEGVRRVLVLSDASMNMGALAAPECDRLVAALDMADALQVPLEWIAISSGARIAMDSGTENLDATARVVRRIVTFTQAGGTIHLIVAGVNIGAQAYFDALATMLMHTRGVLIMTQDASMVLTGRRALEAAGSVSAEDEAAIGGYERIMGPNGEAQYQARTLPDAYRILYEHYRFDYVPPGESAPRRFQTEDPAERSICDFEISDDEFGFATVGEIFDNETNPGRKRPFAMRTVMSAVIDQDGGQLERWHDMVGGETTIIWDAHLGGVPVELIGIESHAATRDGYRPHDGPHDWTGGTLFPLSSKKMARAINAASGVRPVVILANLSGFDGSPESLRKLQLEYGAEIARAVVNFEGPILFSVVSRYHGGAYVVFSQELNPRLEATALTGSFASVIGGGPAASVVFAREVRAQAAADPRVVAMQRGLRLHSSPEVREELEALLSEVTLEKQAEVAAEFDRVHSVERAREVGSLREIMEPAALRPSLIKALRKALDES
ncbi:MAG: carboxyl transferase domain-containing protein, partial [Myxococcota bacterium]